MANRTTIRDRLIEEVTEMWPDSSVVVKYENTGAIQLDTMPRLWAYVYIKFDDTQQVNIAYQPDRRYYGGLNIRLCIKEGEGTRELLKLADKLEAHFGFKTLDGIHLGVPNTEEVKAPPGWYWVETGVPFFADSNT